MKVLVTGATGFIGANLVRGLMAAGHEVRVLRRAASSTRGLAGLPVEHAIGAVEEAESLAGTMAGCQAVIHVAGQFSLWPNQYDRLYRTNVLGTANVVAEALRSGVSRLIYVSSAGAIGLSETPVPLDENAVFNLDRYNLPYHRTKHLAEQTVLAAVRDGLPAVIVNPSMVIGPHDYGLTNLLFRPALKSPVVLWTRGGGNVVAVQDVVAGILAALTRGRIGERYILAGENLPYREQMAIITELAGRTVALLEMKPGLMRTLAAAGAFVHRLIPLPSLVSPQFARIATLWAYYTPAKAEKELGYRWTPYREAVASTLAWYREQGLW